MEGNGVVPVTSGRADDANVYNRRVLDGIHVEMRVIGAVVPDLTVELWGRRYASPIMMPAFSHLNKLGKDGRKPMVAYAQAAKRLGVLNWVGMEPDEEFGEILATGAPTVRIIKPFSDHGSIFRQIAYAKEHGAVAVGLDIDHVVADSGRAYDEVDGMPLGPVTLEDLRSYARYAGEAGLPFVAKGVLSVQDARAAREAGCSAVVVSHHHGRIPFGVAPVQVLPSIKAALQGSGMLVFADCGVDSGYDAYKLLASGADAVSVGRAILAPLLKDGADGVVAQVERMEGELSRLMMYTGVADARSFDPTVLHC